MNTRPPIPELTPELRERLARALAAVLGPKLAERERLRRQRGGA